MTAGLQAPATSSHPGLHQASPPIDIRGAPSGLRLHGEGSRCQDGILVLPTRLVHVGAPGLSPDEQIRGCRCLFPSREEWSQMLAPRQDAVRRVEV